MNGLKNRTEDGLTRIAMLLTLSPIGVAVTMLIVGSLLAKGAPEPVPPILGVSAIALIVAAACSLLIFDRLIVRDLKRIIDYLRAARHGEAIQSPLGVGGLLAEIVEAAEDVVHNQMQLARTISHLHSLETLRDSVERTASDSRSQQLAVSRAVLGLAEDLKAQVNLPPETWISAIARQVEARISQLFVERGDAAGLKSDIEAVDRTVHGLSEAAKLIDANVQALGGEYRAITHCVEQALSGLTETHAAAKDPRLDGIVSSLHGIELAIATTPPAIAISEPSSAVETLKTHFSHAVFELRVEIERAVAAITTRLERASEPARLQHLTLSANEQSQKMDRLAASMADCMCGIGSSLAGLSPCVTDIQQTSQRLTAALADLKQINAAAPANSELLSTRLDRLFSLLDGVVDETAGSRVLIEDLRVVLADHATARSEQAAATETLARGVEMALEIAKERKFSDGIAEGITASTRTLQSVASELSALTRASDMQKDEMAALFSKVAAQRNQPNVQADDANGPRAIATQMEDLQSRVGVALDQLAALPVTIVTHLRAIDDHGLSNDPPATASELSAGVEALQRNFGALAGRVEDALTTITRAAADDVSKSRMAHADIQRLSEAIHSMRALLGPTETQRREGAHKAISPERESLVGRIEDMSRSLDQLADRVEHYMDTAAAPELPVSTSSDAGDAAASYFGNLGHQIDELASRLDTLAELFATFARGQGRSETVFKQTLVPLQERIAALTEANDLGFQRMAGQFGQLANAVAAAPQSVINETRELIKASRIDLSPLQRGLNELSSDVRGLSAWLPATNPIQHSTQATMDAVSVADLSNRLRAEMDELHNRMDHLAQRADQILDLLDESAPAFTVGQLQDPGQQVSVGQQLDRRIDNRQGVATRVDLPDLVPLAQRIEAASLKLVDSLRHWRAPTPVWDPEVMEKALETMQHRIVRSLAGELNGAQRGSSELRHILTGPIAEMHARWDEIGERLARIESVDQTRSQTVATFFATLSAPIKSVDTVVARLTQLANSMENSLPSLRSTSDPHSQDDGTWSAITTRLDHVIASLDQLATNAAASDSTSALLENSAQEPLSKRLDQFQAAVAETLLTLEARWEQPLDQLQASLGSLKQLMGPQISLPHPQPGETLSGELDSPIHSDSFVAALKTMKEFMSAIDNRFNALETLADAVKTESYESVDPGNRVSFDEQIGEMRRLTSEFLDISCAIAEELDGGKEAA